MGAKALFEKLTALADRFELLASSVTHAIISPQIAQRLFTFEDCCRSNFLRRQSVRGDVGTISAFWQTHLHCARCVSLGLRPQKRQALQSSVSLRFAAALYSRSHLASSRAQ